MTGGRGKRANLQHLIATRSAARQDRSATWKMFVAWDHVLKSKQQPFGSPSPRPELTSSLVCWTVPSKGWVRLSIWSAQRERERSRPLFEHQFFKPLVSYPWSWALASCPHRVVARKHLEAMLVKHPNQPHFLLVPDLSTEESFPRSTWSSVGSRGDSQIHSWR